MDDVFFVWRGKKEDLELFVWLLNGIENKVQFTLEIEKDKFLPFLDAGITKISGKTDHKSIQKANPHAKVQKLDFYSRKGHTCCAT